MDKCRLTAELNIFLAEHLTLWKSLGIRFCFPSTPRPPSPSNVNCVGGSVDPLEKR
jgi:hypothetical protein